MLGIFTTPLFAQDSDTSEQVTVTQEEGVEDVDEIKTLSEEIAVSEDSNSDINFLSILFATLTPALLLAVGYILIKMVSK
jgi:hypothetical protein